MLQELDIQNLAIIDKLNVTFAGGMTVLTGETGAGKSIIMDAVSLLTGSRGSKQFLRAHSNKLALQGQFVFSSASPVYHKLDQLGINHDDNTIIIQREIYSSGRNVCRVNGRLVNTNTLRSIGVLMVDIEGQHDHQKLMNPESHLDLLDQFIGDDIQPLLQEYQAEYHQYLRLKKMSSEKQNHQQLWAQRLDMLKFQSTEISNAHLKSGEEDHLKQERDQLKNYQSIVDALKESLMDINGNGTFVPLDAIGDAMNQLKNVADYSKTLNSISDDVSNAYYLLQDAANEISSQLDSQELDEGRLGVIEDRLSLIFNLKHKYGDSVDAIIRYHQKIDHELEQMQSNQKDGSNLAERLKKSEQKLRALSQRLDQIRHQAAQRLTTLVHQQLSDLYMSKTRFAVHFTKLSGDALGAHGDETVEFYLQSNPGEGFHPLSQIASGGELSRIMLALKTIFVRFQGVGTVIFDEVDTGVSGRVAQAIAEKISQIAQKTQVLCITHLAQVAAIADHHDMVNKIVHDNRTETQLQLLNQQQQVQELARMIAGSKVTELTLQHANEMLRMAHNQN